MAGREELCNSKDFVQRMELPVIGGKDAERNKGWGGMKSGNTSTHKS